MPDNISTQIADALTVRQLQVARAEAGVRAQVLALLRATEADILDALKRMDPSEPGALSYRQQRLTRLLRTIQPVIQDGYGTIADDTSKAMLDIASAEVEGTAQAVNEVLGVDLLHPRVAEVTLRALVNDTLLPTAITPTDLSATGREWWSRQAGVLEQRFFDTVNVGVVQAESLQQLVNRVRGTRANGYTDGVMDLARRDAQRLVRTWSSAVLNQSRTSTYEANQDVIKGLQHLSTMDGRTSLLCLSRSGNTYTLDHQPIPPTVHPYAQLPLHWNCRSTYIPLLKSFRELAGDAGAALDAKLQAIGPGTRASMDGQVAADTTFEQFLTRKGEAFQQKLLGKARWQLWKDGRLTLRQLLDSATGEVIPVSALRTMPPPAPARPRWGDTHPLEGPLHDRAFGKAPAHIQEIVRRVPALNDVQLSQPTTSHYRASARRVVLGKSHDGIVGEVESVWRHEYGHHVDYVSQQGVPGGTASSLVAQEIAQDARELRNASQAARKQRFEAIVEEYRQSGQESRVFFTERYARYGYQYDDIEAVLTSKSLLGRARAAASMELQDVGGLLQAMDGVDVGQVQDFMGAITNNRLKFPWAHSTEYYKQGTPTAARGLTSFNTTEAFANWFAAAGAESSLYRRLIANFAPRTHAAFERIVAQWQTPPPS